MTLDAFYAAIGPFLEGTQAHAEAVQALWGKAPPEPDARRLAIYGRFCRVHRFEAVDSVFSETRAAIARLYGPARWAALVEAHFRRHRMHHVELNENGLTLPAFLLDSASLPGGPLPAWLPELADLEAWDFRTRVAPDVELDAPGHEGPLRLASTAELRPYTHDLVAWMDAEDPRPKAPDPTAVRVLFWRDPELDPRRENASESELLVLKAVLDGASVPRRLAETLEDLRTAGIVLGTP